MKVLVFNPLVAVWRPRLPAVLTVIQDLLDNGHEVVAVGCERCVPACTASLDHSRFICGYCMGRWHRGLDHVDGPFDQKRLSDYLTNERMNELRHSADRFETLDELRGLAFEGADVGYAALSSFSYVARNPTPDLNQEKVRSVIQKLVNTGKLVYSGVTEAIRKEQPDQVVLYHGRGAIDRAALRACQVAGVDCYVYETALGINKLLRFKNALPQDIDYFAEDVEAFWANSKENDKAEIGASFFTMRSSGTSNATTSKQEITTQDKSYVGHQISGSLPEGWQREKKNVVIFGSSDDEFVAINPDYEDTVYANQLDAVDQLAGSLAADEEIRLYFRMHPRQKGAAGEFTARLKALEQRHGNLTVVAADSKISSYTLLEHLDIAVSFRSTMSVEAVFAGKPSIVLANSIFKPLGATYNPESHAQVVELLRSELPPKDKLQAIKIGYHRMRTGFAHPYFQADIRKGSEGYTFKGQGTGLGGLRRLMYILAREWQRRKWRAA